MLSVLQAGSDKIDAVIEDLEDADIDWLIQYVYRGLADESAKNAALLFKWHSKLIAKDGVACVVRAISDSQGMLDDTL